MYDLKSLGKSVPHVYVGADAALLERVENPMRHENITPSITLTTDEFTSICPVTGGPDFGSITIVYGPDSWIVESKSLKLYFESFRMEPTFHEKVVAKICYDLKELIQPLWIDVTGKFKPRGGIEIEPSCSYSWESADKE
jgi:7-cyano-7-deazaguanine reductase